jgi:hypothetical protein
MAKEYTKDQIWELFEQLPEELKDAIFAVKTADEIHMACEKNNVEKEKIPAIAKLTGNVMLGILPPDEFQTALEKKIGLKPDVAKKVLSQINRFIFFPIRNELEQLYKITSSQKDSSSDATVTEKKPFSLKPDTYRESL